MLSVAGTSESSTSSSCTTNSPCHQRLLHRPTPLPNPAIVTPKQCQPSSQRKAPLRTKSINPIQSVARVHAAPIARARLGRPRCLLPPCVPCVPCVHACVHTGMSTFAAHAHTNECVRSCAHARARVCSYCMCVYVWVLPTSRVRERARCSLSAHRHHRLAARTRV